MKRFFTGADISRLYEAEGRIPYAVEEAISKHKIWREITVDPNRIDSHISALDFEGKSEKPRFDKIVKSIETGRDIHPILIENTTEPTHAHQVEGATFEAPIDGYARLAAHKKAKKLIKVLIPADVAIPKAETEASKSRGATPMEMIYGNKRLAEIKEQELQRTRGHFKGARLEGGIWINKEGKKFARLGEYPDLEPALFQSKAATKLKRKRKTHKTPPPSLRGTR